MNYKGLWYYFGNDAKMYFGLREVNGILYYFGSRMYQDESVTVDGKNYYCKSSGEAVELSKNGLELGRRKLFVCKRWSTFERMPRENRGCLLLFWLFRSYAF